MIEIYLAERNYSHNQIKMKRKIKTKRKMMIKMNQQRKKEETNSMTAERDT